MYAKIPVSWRVQDPALKKKKNGFLSPSRTTAAAAIVPHIHKHTHFEPPLLLPTTTNNSIKKKREKQ
jgi:hypothetical protein